MVPSKLRDALQTARGEIETLRAQNDQLRGQIDEVRRENQALHRRLDDLEGQLAASRRAEKRQAAPFSKGEPNPAPKRPGRRAGAAYGKAGHRLPPPPDRVDASRVADVPTRCVDCGGPVDADGTAEQFQEEVPVPRPVVTRFVVALGRCRGCGRRVQGRHPLQTSDALGAASAQLGPRAQAVAGWLMKRMGLSAAKAAAVLQEVTGIAVTPGALVQAAQRLGQRGEPAYEQLRAQVRQSRQVSPDETGWRIGGRRAWLWAFVTADTTLYTIAPSRGGDVIAAILGADYDGIVVRDGWAPYRQLVHAEHQTCTAHLLRRCHEILETAQGRAREIPLAVKRLLLDALEVRDRRDRGALTDAAVALAVTALEARLTTLLDRPRITRAANRTLLKHLRRERAALFTFLRHRGVDATNWRAEQAIRPAVVNRKVWGGNRTPRGARSHAVLMSVMQTCKQRQADVLGFLTDLQQVPNAAPPLLLPAPDG